MTEQRVLCSARLCQHQLKVGILNPNTSLSTKTEHSKAGLHKTAEQQGQDNCCKHKYSQGCWQVSLIKFLKKERFVYDMLEKYGKMHIVLPEVKIMFSHNLFWSNKSPKLKDGRKRKTATY